MTSPFGLILLAEAYNSRGNAKRKLGQHFAAISDYDIAIRLNPDDADAYYNRGNAKVKLEQYFAAISDYDIAIRINPDDASAYICRGYVKYRLGRTLTAKKDFRTALRLAIKAGDVNVRIAAEKALRFLNE